MRKTAGLALAFALTACVSSPVQPPLRIATPFSMADYAWYKAPGRNTINGNAVLRTVGGDAKTCAGLPVALIPGGAYTRERMNLIYGNIDRGYLPAGQRQMFENDAPEFHTLRRDATCDAQGDFTYSGLPDGEYFLLAQVVWGVPMEYHTETQGGTMMQRVEVRGGETKRVVLSY